MKMARLAQILAQPVFCPRIAYENYLRRARLTLRHLQTSDFESLHRGQIADATV
jgi:hypothetical protein